MNVHKNKKISGNDLERSKTTCERPEIQDVNVFNSISNFQFKLNVHINFLRKSTNVLKNYVNKRFIKKNLNRSF